MLRLRSFRKLFCKIQDHHIPMMHDIVDIANHLLVAENFTSGFFGSFFRSEEKTATYTEPFSNAMIMKFVSTFSGNHRTFVAWLIAITCSTNCIKRVPTNSTLFFISCFPMPRCKCAPFFYSHFKWHL